MHNSRKKIRTQCYDCFVKVCESLKQQLAPKVAEMLPVLSSEFEIGNSTI